MVVATPTLLYLGHSGPNGVTVFRTVNPAASRKRVHAESFEGGGSSAAQNGNNNGYGGVGLGNTVVTRSSDAKALTFAASCGLRITAGSSTTPIELVELP